MKSLSLTITNPEPILKNLEKLFASELKPEYFYLAKPAQEDYENPLNLTTHKNVLGMSEYLLPEVIHLMGIRSMSVLISYDMEPINQLSRDLLSKLDLKGEEILKNEMLVAEFRKLFSQTRTIAFDDWSGFIAASALWPLLLEKVIEPSQNENLDFIFYLGDPAKKSTFQVDEVLALMANFSKRGSVTLAVDQAEALSLWRLLNAVDERIPLGDQTIHELKRKYFSLYKSMSITRLLVYSTNDAMLFSSDDQFVLTRKLADTSTELGISARQNFVSGLSTGILMGNEIARSIAIGLVVFGASGPYNSFPGLSAVQEYIADWIADLEKPDAIFLYQ